MSQGSGSGSGGIPGGPLGPILVALFGLGAAGAIIWTVTRGGGGDNQTIGQPTLPPTVASPSEVPPTEPPTNSRGPHGAAAVDKTALKVGYDDAVVIVFTMYGMPPQVGLEADDPADIITQRFEVQCLAEVTFPNPCVQYYIVRNGAHVRIVGGDSRAGFWPALESVQGGGCDMEGDGGDFECLLVAAADTDIVAIYYGGESPGLSHYTYPTCPTQRGQSPPSWMSRCP